MSARLSASGDGRKPFSASLEAINASMGFRMTDDGRRMTDGFRTGIAGRFGGTYDQCCWYCPPCLIQRTRSKPWAGVNFFVEAAGGMTNAAFLDWIRWTRRLFSG